MNEDEIVLDENSNTSEEVTPEVTEESETEQTEETVDWKALALKEKQRADNLKIRAEKAEKAPARVEPSTSLGANDLVALMNNKVHEDDVSEVEEYARFKKITVSEALKSSVMKTLLSERNEQRDIANATNTGPSRKSNTKLNDSTLLKYAREGRNVEDPVALAEARWAEKNKGK